MIPGYHAIFVGLTTGFMALSFLLVTFRFWACPRVKVSQQVRDAADLVALWSAAGGVGLMALATVTGLLTRPLPALLSSPITNNKMLLTALSLVCWAGFVALRAKAGGLLWVRRGPAAHAAWVLALAGFGYMISVNSIGGALAGIPSGYEEFARVVGYQTRRALYFPTFFNVVLLLVGVAAVVGAVICVRRRVNTGEG